MIMLIIIDKRLTLLVENKYQKKKVKDEDLEETNAIKLINYFDYN